MQECFRAIAGDAGVRTWENLDSYLQQRISLAIATGAVFSPPSCIVYPHSPEELAEVMTAATANKYRVLVCGHGSKLDWGNVSSGVDVVVSTQRLNQIVEHAVGDFTVTVQAGVKFADLQAVLSKEGQFFAIDPCAPEQASLGGIIATGDTGSMRQRYGSVREQILGISFVRADGKIAKAGGRVVKNVAGYDLMKLFTGSYGSLGIMTQVTLRLYPIQESSTTVVLTGEAENISLAISSIRASALTPTQFDLISRGCVEKLAIGNGFGLMVRFQSISESVQEQTQKIIELGQSLNLKSSQYSGKDEIDLWMRSQHQIHHPSHADAIVCKIGVLPAYSLATLAQVEIGRIHLTSGVGNIQCQDVSQVQQLRGFCQSHQGYLTIQTASPTSKTNLDIWGYTSNALTLMRSLKSQFDPMNLLNPGKFIV